MKLKTIIQQTGKTTTGIELPPDDVAKLGAGKRPPITVTINGYTYRTSVGVMNGKSMASLSKANREAAGIAAGDHVTVVIELDTQPRTVEVPEDFAAALDAEPNARARFETLSYSDRSWHVLQIAAAKAPETRERRIARSVAALAQGRKR